MAIIAGTDVQRTARPGTGKCSNPAKPNGSDCTADSSACTVDTCQNGICTAGTPQNCAHLNDQCNIGVCNTVTGSCGTEPKSNGTVCDDGNACTRTDTCQDGRCVASNPVTCSASDDCHEAGACNPTTGQCSDPPKPNGSRCSDDNACTDTDTCQDGRCTSGTAVVCDPPGPCRLSGSCNSATGSCEYANKPDDTPCSTGALCTVGETCQSGVCSGGSPKICENENLCLVGTCNPQTGQCVYTPKDCDDNNPCTLDTCDPVTGCLNTPKYNLAQLERDDACHTYTCDPQTGDLVTTPVDCDDGNRCTIDTCDPAVGCLYTPISCDDGNPCTVDSCDPTEGCRNVPLTQAQMDDNNACTRDYCVPNRGIVHEPITCDSDDPCTTGTCDPALGCVFTSIACSPLDQCHIAGICDSQTGQCSNPAAPNGIGCSLPHAIAICQAGVCTVTTCDAGYANCTGGQSDGCEIDITTTSHCGTCGNVCPTGASCTGGACVCPLGQIACGGACVDNTSTTNCGTCGNVCHGEEGCFDGECRCSTPGLNLCGDICVALYSDPNNCGSCGLRCPAGQDCVAGVCMCVREECR